jgi:hypothetical protein
MELKRRVECLRGNWRVVLPSIGNQVLGRRRYKFGQNIPPHSRFTYVTIAAGLQPLEIQAIKVEECQLFF